MNIGDEVIISAKVVGITESNNPIIQVKSGVRMLIKESDISALSENKGEWIEVVTERFPNGEKRMWHYECSACSTGEPPCPINKEHWDFCPNCGADMRGKAE